VPTRLLKFKNRVGFAALSPPYETLVIAGLVPAISLRQVLSQLIGMAGTSPAMT
jgi:hypothetical protein